MATLYQRRQLRRLSRAEHDARVRSISDTVMCCVLVSGFAAFALWQIAEVVAP